MRGETVAFKLYTGPNAGQIRPLIVYSFNESKNTVTGRVDTTETDQFKANEYQRDVPYDKKHSNGTWCYYAEVK